MLDGRSVDAAAADAISVVDEDRGGRRAIGPQQGGYYTLEGAVAAVLYQHLDEPFEQTLRRAIKAAEDEETGLRLGFLDPRDLDDYGPEKPETEENMPRSRAEILEGLLCNALEELKTIREHDCEFTESGFCSICGLDGNA